MTPPLHHFYHCYADGDWTAPVTEHCFALTHSGLYEQLDTFQVGFVGTAENVAAVRSTLDTLTPRYEVCAQAETGWEQVTLDALYEFAQNRDGLVFYAHTKGAANYDRVNTAWRRDMEFHCVCEWRHCVAAFDNPAVMAAGAHWIPNARYLPGHESTSPHAGIFGGNYWWTRLGLLGRGRPPRTDYRHAAEAWVGYLVMIDVPMGPANIHDRCPNPIIRNLLHATHHCGQPWPD